MFSSEMIEDGKVIASAALAVVLDAAQVCNQVITLFISLSTLVYVAARAYQTIKALYPVKKTSAAKRRKRQC